MAKQKDSDAEGVELEHQAPEGVDPSAIAKEWADKYPAGAELFCGTFDADDFDDFYGEKSFPDKTTIAIRRGTRKPTPGWIRRHSHLGAKQITLAVLEKHASERALEILDNLTSEAWEDFIDAWGDDGEILPKSSRSARRSANKKRPSGETSSP